MTTNKMIKSDCELASECTFFHTFNQRKSIAWQGFLNVYCKAGVSFLCERRKYQFETGCQPSANLMPTGRLVPPALAALP